MFANARREPITDFAKHSPKGGETEGMKNIPRTVKIMKLEELYTKVISDEGLQKAFMTAASEGKITEFLKANGCEEAEEEAKAFLASKQNKTGELSDDELDSVAGGRKCGTAYYEGHPIVSNFNSCGNYRDRELDGNGYCMDCTYLRTGADGWLPLCTCPARKDN